MGDHLVLNGDLFAFWFEYRSVIPRSAFTTLAALATVRRRGVRLTVTGGNHDRWGGPFWQDELGASFHRGAVELNLAGHHALVTHGDDLAEPQISARLLRAVVRHPLTEAVFRWVHPDVGWALVGRMSRWLARKSVHTAVTQHAAAIQGEYAHDLLEQRPELELVVLGHTHKPVLEEVERGRWYVNPGAWMDGLRYARINEMGPELCVFEGR